MKISLVLLILFFSQPVFSQDTLKNPKTEIGKAIIKVGSIIKKEFIDIYSYATKGIFVGQYDDIDIKILNITDASTQVSISGLAVKKTATSYSAFIDSDEIPGLLKFIELLSQIDSEKPENYTEYIFNSKDLEVYAYFSSSTNPNLFSNKKVPPSWHYGIKIDQFYSESAIRVDLKILKEISDAIIKSKSKL